MSISITMFVVSQRYILDKMMDKEIHITPGATETLLRSIALYLVRCSGMGDLSFRPTAHDHKNLPDFYGFAGLVRRGTCEGLVRI